MLRFCLDQTGTIRDGVAKVHINNVSAASVNLVLKMIIFLNPILHKLNSSAKKYSSNNSTSINMGGAA